MTSCHFWASWGVCALKWYSWPMLILESTPLLDFLPLMLNLTPSTAPMRQSGKYSEVSAVRNQYFATARPASAMVEISNTVAAGCDVEIEVMAMIDKPAGESHE